jgi:hypothetical protein
MISTPSDDVCRTMRNTATAMDATVTAIRTICGALFMAEC